MNGNNRLYNELLELVQIKIRQAQQKAVFSINRELLILYWETGKLIAQRQQQEGWGSAIIPRLSRDINNLLPEIKGYSIRNIGRMIAFYREYPDADLFLPQPVAKNKQPSNLPQPEAKIESLIFSLPWGHNILLLEKVKDRQHRLFYMQQALLHGWSRNVLALMYESQLHARDGCKLSNFSALLPPEQSDMVRQALKDPYVFDFLSIGSEAHEREVEKALINHMEKFILELGAGFAFVGRQYHLEVAGKDFYIDLLFYHLKLRCFVVIELKDHDFKPEYAGKMNFYLSVVDDLIKHASDQPSIGLILCKSKDNVLAEYTLRDMSKPIGLAEYRLTENLPENIKAALPTIEELEAELAKNLKNNQT